jgi:hypothetical protein
MLNMEIEQADRALHVAAKGLGAFLHNLEPSGLKRLSDIEFLS